jgi:nucleoside 2-deoxyribosyltransferase
MSASTRPRVLIYLAGPLGFSEAGRHFYNTVLVPFVESLGYEALDPWTLTEPRKIQAVQRMPYGPAKREAWRTLNLEMGATNRAAIDRARGVVAVLDGTDVDSGTAAEIGYAFARGKPIVGYRGDFRLSADNEGSIVNLQVEYFIRASGGMIVERFEDLGPALGAVGLRWRPASRGAPGASPAGGRRPGRRRRVR